LDDVVVESFLVITREFMTIVFQEKELMGINLLMFIIYASQIDVNVKLAEDGLDLILVYHLQFLIDAQEWLRHQKVGIAFIVVLRLNHRSGIQGRNWKCRSCQNARADLG
jgi:hypothetical protein